MLLNMREERKRRKTISIAAMAKVSKIRSSRFQEKRSLGYTVLTCKALCSSDAALEKWTKKWNNQ